MLEKLTPRWLIIKLAGLFFSAYSAYNIFIIIRDGGRNLPLEGIIISALVALLFALLTGFAWTSEVRNARFLVVRATVFIVILLMIFALKLRMIGRVIAYLDYFIRLHPVLYGATYFMTQAALLILFVYYAFILKNLPLYPVASIVLPLSAIVLFLFSLILEAVLFFGYGICLEANQLRTVVIRPVFYLGFICLSAHFLFPPAVDEIDVIPEPPL